MKPKRIDPSKATPQASRALRVGSGRTRADEGSGLPAASEKPPGDDEKKDPDDDDDDDDDKDEDGMVAHGAKCSAASEACKAASEKYEAAGKTDSAGALQEAEEASASARQACEDGEASCQRLRGVDMEAEAAPPPPAGQQPPGAPPNAQAIAGEARRTGASHVETAQLVALGRSTMVLLHEADPVRARGKLAARLQIADRAEASERDAGKARVESDAIKRERMWEQALTDGRFRAGQIFAQAEGPAGSDGKPTRIRVPSAYAAKMNAAHPELPALAAFLDAFPKLHGHDASDPSDVLARVAEAKQVAAQHALTEGDAERARSVGVDPALLQAAMAAKGLTPNHDDRRV